MKTLHISTRLLIASLILCTTFAASLLVNSRTVSAASLPIPGIGVTIRKNPSKKSSNARTNQEGKFTVVNLEPGSYTVSLKLDDTALRESKIDFSKFKTAVITIKGVKGGTLIKRIPITELQRGLPLNIEIAGRSAATITGTCVATDEPARSEAQ